MSKTMKAVVQGKVKPTDVLQTKVLEYCWEDFIFKIIGGIITAAFLNVEHEMVSVSTPSRTFQ